MINIKPIVILLTDILWYHFGTKIDILFIHLADILWYHFGTTCAVKTY